MQKIIDVASVIREFVRPGFACLDVGAGDGEMTEVMLESSGVKVSCVEPSSENARKLTSKFGDRIELIQAALGDHNHSRFLKLCGNDSVNHGVNDDATGEPVNIRTLDSIDFNRKIDFVKIDIEGMEFECIKGGLSFLWKHRPIVLFESRIEFETIRNGFPLYRCIQGILSGIGYSLKHVGAPRYLDLKNLDSDTLAIPKA